MTLSRFSALYALLLAACGQSTNSASENKNIYCDGDGIVVSDAWMRAPRAGQKMAAAYVSICNGDGVPDRLVSVSFDGARAAELHNSETGSDGIARMRPAADGILLPAHSVTTLENGAAHIMLVEPDGALSEESEVVMTLVFENAPTLSVLFELRGDDGAHAH